MKWAERHNLLVYPSPICTAILSSVCQELWRGRDGSEGGDIIRVGWECGGGEAWSVKSGVCGKMDLECLLTNVIWRLGRSRTPPALPRARKIGIGSSPLILTGWKKKSKKIQPIAVTTSAKTPVRTHTHGQTCFPRKPEDFDNQCDPHHKLWEAL